MTSFVRPPVLETRGRANIDKHHAPHTYLDQHTLLQHPHENSPQPQLYNRSHTENAPIKHVTRAREERGEWAIRLARLECPPASSLQGGEGGASLIILRSRLTPY